MAAPNATDTPGISTSDADAVAQLLVAARTILTQARVLAHHQQVHAATCARISLAHESISDALDNRITRR